MRQYIEEKNGEKWKAMTCNFLCGPGVSIYCSNVPKKKPEVFLPPLYKMCLRALCNVRLLPQAVNKSEHTRAAKHTHTVIYIQTVHTTIGLYAHSYMREHTTTHVY